MQDTTRDQEEERIEGVYRSSDDYWWSGRIAGPDGQSYRFQHSDLVSDETAYQSGERVTFRADGRFARDVRRSGGRVRPFRVDTRADPGQDEPPADLETSAMSPAGGVGVVAPQGETAASGSSARWLLWPLVVGIVAGLIYVYLS